MKYEELKAKVESQIPWSLYPLAWDEDARNQASIQSEANYTIVPLDDGRFTIYRTDGRGTATQDVDLEDRPLIFENEDAVCDYVWNELNVPRPPSTPYIHGDPEYLAEKRRKLDERMRQAGE